jgi:hypothetical protein
VKTPTLKGLDLLRRENPAALADLRDADYSRRYARALLRDDPAAAAEFGTDDAAAQRLAAVLRHSYADAPLGT